MLIEVILRAAHILRAQPGYTMTLSSLHAQLVTELGPQAGSYVEIYQHLRKRTDSFVLLNAPRLLSPEGWLGVVHENGAGSTGAAGSCMRVALTEPLDGEDSDLVAAVNATISTLAACCVNDLTLAPYVERAAVEAAELSRVLANAAADHPTIPPPDPPPAT